MGVKASVTSVCFFHVLVSKIILMLQVFNMFTSWSFEYLFRGIMYKTIWNEFNEYKVIKAFKNNCN